jgi:hypothetical protein
MPRSLHMLACLHVLALVLAGGCNPTRDDFEVAKRKNTVASWERFLTEHPNSQYEGEARAQLTERKEAVERARRLREQRQRRRAQAERLAWQQARELGTSEALETFLQQHGGGEHAAEARKALDASWRRFVTEAKAGSHPIKPGKSFVDDLLGGKKVFVGDILTMKGQFKSSGSRAGSGYTRQRAVRGPDGRIRTIEPERDVSVGTITLRYSWIPLPAMKIVSTNGNGYVVAFINDTCDAPTLKLTFRLTDGRVVNLDMEGTGYGIARDEGKIVVYEWAK